MSLLAVVFFAQSCSDNNDEPEDSSLSLPGKGLFIVGEGNFQYGNASLSYFNPADNTVENNVFYRANGMKLGDVGQSMTVYNNTGWVVVNNSHAIFAIDIQTGREKGRIENLTSPRFIEFVSDEKAYVTQMWDNRIVIVNPKTYSVTGYITVPGMDAMTGSTEQMVKIGQYMYCTCWSYQNRVIKIDTVTDEIVDEVSPAIQPKSIVADKNHNLWVMTDGGYEGSPVGHEEPRLFCIDSNTLEILKTFTFTINSSVTDLNINGQGDTLYWLDSDVWSMSISDSSLPSAPLISTPCAYSYALTVSPYNNDIYVADAIDFQQSGTVFRYDASGNLITQFNTGVIPGAFCWK